MAFTTPVVGLLVMAYGGPDSMGEVEPYLMDVRGYRPTPPEVVREVRERYRAIGGRSPILERTRAQAMALQAALGDGWRALVGMRHWRPFIKDALAQMAAGGIPRAVGLVMTPHYSRMSVEAYFRKVEQAGVPVDVARIERWHLLPGYLDALADRVRAALDRFPSRVRSEAPIVFTAHSLPRRILDWDDPYPRELHETMEAVVRRLPGLPGERDEVAAGRFHLAYQSAGMTGEAWLGPDAGQVIERLAAQGKRHVLIAPIGFVSEHVEILYDVDIVLKRQAESLGMQLERIEMLNTAPPMIEALADRVQVRAKEVGWR